MVLCSHVWREMSTAGGQFLLPKTPIRVWDGVRDMLFLFHTQCVKLSKGVLMSYFLIFVCFISVLAGLIGLKD